MLMSSFGDPHHQEKSAEPALHHVKGGEGKDVLVVLFVASHWWHQPFFVLMASVLVPVETCFGGDELMGVLLQSGEPAPILVA